MSYLTADDPLVPKRGNLSDFQTWERDGKPFEPPEFKPRSRVRNLNQVNRQIDQLQELAHNTRIIEDGPDVARQPFGNQAPPLQPELFSAIVRDNVDSAAYPEEVFNSFYVRGGVDQKRGETEELVLAGADLPRIDPRVRSEEEIQQFRSQFMLLKGQRLELPEWNPRMFPPDGSCVLFGTRRTGKSWMMRYLLWQYRYLYRAVIIITNTKQNDFWGQYVPFRFIHTPYDPFVIGRILEQQKALLAFNKLNAGNPGAIINPYIAIILDDVVSGNMHHDPMLNALFYEGRHSCISIFIATQYPKALPPGVRGNADLVVVFPQDSLVEQDIIREQYFNFFESKDDWQITLMEYTRDHSCIVLNMSEKTVPQIQRIYTYKASDPGPFILGCREFWIGDEDARRKYYEGLAGMLKKQESGNESTPTGWSWLSDESSTNALISQMTF